MSVIIYAILQTCIIYAFTAVLFHLGLPKERRWFMAWVSLMIVALLTATELLPALTGGGCFIAFLTTIAVTPREYWGQ
jgi:hypothetical protein